MTNITNICHTRWTKDCLLKECARLGITVPKSATKLHLQGALIKYFINAAIVHTENGLEIRQTDKPTAEYSIYLNIGVSRTVRAESEAAAIEWLIHEADDCYLPHIGELDDMCSVEIIDVYKHEED